MVIHESPFSSPSPPYDTEDTKHESSPKLVNLGNVQQQSWSRLVASSEKQSRMKKMFSSDREAATIAEVSSEGEVAIVVVFFGDVGGGDVVIGVYD
ncbi:hypothetical protein Q3G72_031293 [Acer saccharum]|nr:hypothetical protein Q3G72_031293 [Acer saccharum]